MYLTVCITVMGFISKECKGNGAKCLIDTVIFRGRGKIFIASYYMCDSHKMIVTRVIRKRVPEVLQEVGLAGKYKAYPDELSGGEQQRVALARAIVNRPDILLADEPTGNLDPKTSEEIMKLLEEINQRGTTVLVVTHNKEIVNSMKKRVLTMHNGVIISDEKEGEYYEA